jgi:hypothetical protein
MFKTQRYDSSEDIINNIAISVNWNKRRYYTIQYHKKQVIL